MKLIWQDEFNGNSLDTLKINRRDLGERRDAVNVKEDVSVRNGKLLYFAGREEGVAVSDALQYIILSSEVKDNGWAGKIPAKGFGTFSEDRTKMLVDWVRVYKPKPR